VIVREPGTDVREVMEAEKAQRVRPASGSSGARHRPCLDRRSSGPRHWNPFRGKPWRKSAAGPLPRSTYAIRPNGVATRRRDAWNAAASSRIGSSRPPRDARHPGSAAAPATMAHAQEIPSLHLETSLRPRRSGG
jgi:hypothetical protein